MRSIEISDRNVVREEVHGPNRNVLHAKTNRELGALASLDQLPLEASKHTRWLARRLGETLHPRSNQSRHSDACKKQTHQIQLRNFIPIILARVFHRERHADRIRPQPRASTGLYGALRHPLRVHERLDRQTRVGERRVTQPEAELVPGFDVGAVEVAVVDVYFDNVRI